MVLDRKQDRKYSPKTQNRCTKIPYRIRIIIPIKPDDSNENTIKSAAHLIPKIPPNVDNSLMSPAPNIRKAKNGKRTKAGRSPPAHWRTPVHPYKKICTTSPATAAHNIILLGISYVV